MTRWQDDTIALPRPRGLQWLRVTLRGAAIALVTFGGLVLLLVLRLIERPLFSPGRPITPFITQGVCRANLFILGLRRITRGNPMAHHGASVANHVSWLDIFVLNAGQRVYFVAKSEVARWPGIGWLARATGTLFIARKGTEAKAQQTEFETRLQGGHRLLFFPEGTSTDGLRVLPFKSSLFAAFLSPDLADGLYVQPVTLSYRAPPGCDPRFYGWWGDMEFAPSLLMILARSPQGSVEITWHPSLRVAGFADRKALTAACEDAVRGAFIG